MQSIWISATAGSCHPVQLFLLRPGRMHQPWPCGPWKMGLRILCEWLMLVVDRMHLKHHVVFCMNNPRHFGLHTEIGNAECSIQVWSQKCFVPSLCLYVSIIRFTCIKINDSIDTKIHTYQSHNFSHTYHSLMNIICRSNHHTPCPPVNPGITKFVHLEVSKNSGTTKSSILIGFSLINHPFWGGVPLFWGWHPFRMADHDRVTTPDQLQR